MAKTHQRVFALVAALLFLASSIAFSVFVLWEMRNNGDSQSPNEDLTSIQEQLEQQSQCQIGQDSGEAKTAPEVFRPEGDVTQLQVTDLEQGDGTEVEAGDCLLVKYHGTLASNGEKFDGNFDEPSVLRVPIGQGSVIPGWDQGLIGMKEGGLRRLVIPSELAYGDQASETIPANSDLVFVVELIEIEE